ncbi:MAG TPA: hypothetical protein VHU80_03300 [Polyangiaceae bacterium]|nr:hypothetical protein [Polyangiaceae bacterium]
MTAREPGPRSADASLPAARPRRASPFLALASLWGLYELPTVFSPNGIDLHGVRPTGDFLVLLAAYPFVLSSEHRRVLRRIWFVCLGVLIAVRIDWTACWIITRSRPLLYDQLFLFRHLFVLVGDLWSAPMALCLVALGLVTWGIVRLSCALGRASRPVFAPPERRRTTLSLCAAVGVCAALTLVRIAAGTTEPLVHWILPELADNLHQSVRTYRAVREGIFDSPYKAYAGIRLVRRPNVTFIFVESYGKIIADSADLAARLTPRLTGVQRSLGQEGWHMVSGYSTAPVSGGRSWLAVGSIFMGTSVPYESIFRHLVHEGAGLPSIPSFLAERGYDTVGLEPSDRVRPGVEEVNYYHLARQIHFDDLHYTGRAIGWGLVPDQYSLGFAEDNVLAGEGERPRFFMFHMVSSHVPWSTVPSLVDDWHALNDDGGAPIGNAHGEHPTLYQLGDGLYTRLHRYGREGMRRLAEYRDLSLGYRERYVDDVAYDLSVIERHLLREHGDELVVVMGDHQPPAVAPPYENFDVPVHVFARDPALLAEFVERGFRPGLLLDSTTKPVVDHAGIFSLLVRALMRVQPGRPVPPPYLRHGMPLTG